MAATPREIREIVVKTAFNDDIRRLAPPGPWTLDALRSRIRESYALGASFSLRYTDTDGDAVTLSDPADFAEAIRCALEMASGGTRPVLRVQVLQDTKQDDKEEAKKEAKKVWFQHVEKLAAAKRLVVILGPSAVKAELLSFGNAFFVRTLSNGPPTGNGNGRLRVVPQDDGEPTLEFNAGFGKWARFTADELEDGCVAFKSAGCPGAYLSLSAAGALTVSNIAFRFSLRSEDGTAAVRLADMQPVQLDFGLRVAKEMLGAKAKALGCEAHVGMRIAAEHDMQLGSTSCKLLKLENNNVCIKPLEPHPMLGDGNVRVREAGTLDFRGRRGQWAQFEARTGDEGLVLFHRVTGTFLGASSTGELISAAEPYTFRAELNGALEPTSDAPAVSWILVHMQSRNNVQIVEVKRFDSESEAHAALAAKEAGQVWVGFVAAEGARGERWLSRASTSKKDFSNAGTTPAEHTLACCAANGIKVLGKGADPLSHKDAKVAHKEAKRAEKEAKKVEKEAKKAEKQLEKEAKKTEKQPKLAEKEAKIAAKLAEKEAKKAEKRKEKEARPVTPIELQLGPFEGVFSKLPDSSNTFTIKANEVLGDGNIRFLPNKDGEPAIDFNGGRGKWARFRVEPAPFEQVFLVNDATGRYLGLDRDETHLVTCDGYKFTLKDPTGGVVSAAALVSPQSPATSDWEELEGAGFD